jgi:hypothetical protein
MSPSEMRHNDTTGSGMLSAIDMKLEVVVIPVRMSARAKGFYTWSDHNLGVSLTPTHSLPVFVNP